MTSEAEWLGLYNRLGELLGPQHADTLVNNLVTKADIAGLATKADIAGLATKEEMAQFQAELLRTIIEHQKSLTAWTVGSMVALTAIFSAVMVVVTG